MKNVIILSIKPKTKKTHFSFLFPVDRIETTLTKGGILNYMKNKTKITYLSIAFYLTLAPSFVFALTTTTDKQAKVNWATVNATACSVSSNYPNAMGMGSVSGALGNAYTGGIIQSNLGAPTALSSYTITCTPDPASQWAISNPGLPITATDFLTVNGIAPTTAPTISVSANCPSGVNTTVSWSGGNNTPTYYTVVISNGSGYNSGPLYLAVSGGTSWTGHLDTLVSAPYTGPYSFTAKACNDGTQNGSACGPVSSAATCVVPPTVNIKFNLLNTLKEFVSNMFISKVFASTR